MGVMSDSTESDEEDFETRFERQKTRIETQTPRTTRGYTPRKSRTSKLKDYVGDERDMRVPSQEDGFMTGRQFLPTAGADDSVDLTGSD